MKMSFPGHFKSLILSEASLALSSLLFSNLYLPPCCQRLECPEASSLQSACSLCTSVQPLPCPDILLPAWNWGQAGPLERPGAEEGGGGETGQLRGLC